MTLLTINGLLPLGLNTYWDFLPLRRDPRLPPDDGADGFYFGYVYLFDAETARIPGVA